MERYYKINESYLLFLLMEEAKLEALELGGVDTWKGYQDARANYLSRVKYLYKQYQDNIAYGQRRIEEGDLSFRNIAENRLDVFFNDKKIEEGDL